MRKLNIKLLGLFALCVAFFACQKDDEVTPKPVEYPIVGLWEGTQVSTAIPGDEQYYALSIKPDSSISVEGIAEGMQHYAIGTWSLVDSHFVSHIKTIYGFDFNIGVEQTLTAIYNTKNRELKLGKWINTTWGKDSGTFNVQYVK